MIIISSDLKMHTMQEAMLENQALLKAGIWIDLLSPSKEEETQIEQCLNLNIPTREEMVEIELSSRLYKENDTLFMTATMIAQSDSADPKFDPVTFVLTQHQLITIRYIEPQSFKIVTSHLEKFNSTHIDATLLLIELLDATIDRLADMLELIGHRLEESSKAIFRPEHNAPTRLNYQKIMRQIGANGDLNTKARESLVTFDRLITFFKQTAGSRIGHEGQLRLATLSKDIASLGDHTNFLSTKVNFLLDGTLGMVSIEQNNIIKIFSVAAVIFLPPTLVASIYGMNFHFMPELSWKYGYLIAIGLIIVAAWLPYKYFKYRKWL
jgi:magnesium transporter